MDDDLKLERDLQDAEVQEPDAQSLVGKTGVATSELRPAGIAEIEGERVDVVTEGEFINEGASVEVTEVEGNRIVVKERSGN